LTKKEIIEKGWVEKYVLGLTAEDESAEVERLAFLYPELQAKINLARTTICSKFNRSLTQPAIRTTFLTRKKMMAFAVILISLFSLGFVILCGEHFSLQANYTEKAQQLAFEQAKVSQLVSYSKEKSIFLHSPSTRRIKLKPSGDYPDAEAMIFQGTKSGRMLLRVVDLPELPEGQHFEIWAEQPQNKNELIGTLNPPLRFDSLYVLQSLPLCSKLMINSVDPVTKTSLPVCAATLTN
jgi:hypothetical protein